MKKLLIIMALTVWNTGIYAQKVFDEAVAKEMLGRLENDPANFFANETSPNFKITFGNGVVFSRDEMLTMIKSMTDKYSRTEENLKVDQIGGTAVITGITAEKFTNPQTMVVTNLPKEHFTYTFSQVKGKWLMVSAQHTDVPTPFTKETLNELLAEYKTDSKAFFNSHLSEDFRYINNEGEFQPQKDFLGGTKQSIVTTEMLDPVIFQSGNLAITSGIHKTVRTTSDGKQETVQVGATYTWQNRNGKWMFVGSQQNIKQDDNEEQAIKNVIMKETDEFKKATSLDDYMSVYANNKDVKLGPYRGKILNYEEIKVAADNIIKNKLYPKGPTEYTDWVVKINGNSAFVTEKQVNTQNNGIKMGSMKADYLEKINGEWKIVDHRFSPIANTVEEDEAAIKSTIEGETMAGWATDTEKEFSFWKQSPNASWIGGVQNKAYSFIGFENIKKTAIDMHKNAKVNLNALPVLENSDYSININGNSAFVTYIQAQTDKGKTGKTRENRYLEKINGEWKIVNATFIVDGNTK